jgi:hypothetical protein
MDRLSALDAFFLSIENNHVARRRSPVSPCRAGEYAAPIMVSTRERERCDLSKGKEVRS